MKNIIITLILVFGVSFYTFESYAENKEAFSQKPKIQAGQYDPKGESILVTAKGLVCEFCAKALEKVFLRREEVSGINVNLTTKEIFINLKEGKTLDTETVEKLITDAGYNVGDISRKQGSDF